MTVNSTVTNCVTCWTSLVAQVISVGAPNMAISFCDSDRILA